MLFSTFTMPPLANAPDVLLIMPTQDGGVDRLTIPNEEFESGLVQRGPKDVPVDRLTIPNEEFEYRYDKYRLFQ
jgi:hypothetical protein